MLQTVGRVKIPQGCQTFFAETALVEGALRIPLYLDHPTVFYLDQDAAIVKADAAGGFYFTVNDQRRYLRYGVQNKI
jgi:hypothetical protein